jgi:hypothetical protein
MSVIWEDPRSPGEHHVEMFAGLHFRTGHLNKMKAALLPGEDAKKYHKSFSSACHQSVSEL